MRRQQYNPHEVKWHQTFFLLSLSLSRSLSLSVSCVDAIVMMVHFYLYIV